MSVSYKVINEFIFEPYWINLKFFYYQHRLLCSNSWWSFHHLAFVHCSNSPLLYIRPSLDGTRTLATKRDDPRTYDRFPERRYLFFCYHCIRDYVQKHPIWRSELLRQRYSKFSPRFSFGLLNRPSSIFSY